MPSFENRRALFEGIARIKQFFLESGFLETPVPPMVQNPGYEVHLHPMQVQGKNLGEEKFLHTSPEFWMKHLLSQGFDKIFCLEYCFRDEPKSETHRPQFLMLEWYRAHVELSQIQSDVEELTQFFFPKASFQRASVDELFQELLGFSILNFLDKSELKNKIKSDFPKYYQSEIQQWEDLYFLLFLNFIEPKLKAFPFLFVEEFPSPLAALSEIDPKDSRVSQRFEVYMGGVEIANCFKELTDLSEQKRRFEEDHQKKLSLYQYELPKPSVLFNALSDGLPPSCGIALGVERFLGQLSAAKQTLFFS